MKNEKISSSSFQLAKLHKNIFNQRQLKKKKIYKIIKIKKTTILENIIMYLKYIYKQCTYIIKKGIKYMLIYIYATVTYYTFTQYWFFSQLKYHKK